jgi:hypothetical protein
MRCSAKAPCVSRTKWLPSTSSSSAPGMSLRNARAPSTVTRPSSLLLPQRAAPSFGQSARESASGKGTSLIDDPSVDSALSDAFKAAAAMVNESLTTCSHERRNSLLYDAGESRGVSGLSHGKQCITGGGEPVRKETGEGYGYPSVGAAHARNPPPRRLRGAGVNQQAHDGWVS